MLHDRGYQKLRLCTAIAPSGLNFRYIIALVSHFEANGMYFDYNYADEALLTSSNGMIPPFDWPEALDMDPQALADLFLLRRPELAAAGFGADLAYARWYKEMLEITRPNGLAIFYSDSFTALVHGIKVMNLNRDVKVPLAPAPDPRLKDNMTRSLLGYDALGGTSDLSKLEPTQVGIAGEYYVAAELAVRGYVASITLRNSRGIDILASNADATCTISIQVKTNKGGTPKWIIGKKAETFATKEHFYALVILRPLEQRPDFYIVPSEVVAHTVKTEHATWLMGMKKDGGKRKDSTMRIFRDSAGQFKEAWYLLGL